MKKKAAVATVAIAIVVCVSACSTDNTANEASADSQGTYEPQSYDEIFNQDPEAAGEACTAYDVLINQGWKSDEVYDELKIRGFDWDHDTFNALIKWCYDNDY